MIAMALSTRPRLLIADEPTTALDVTIQAQVLDLMKELVAEFGMGILFITHDLGVIAQTADRVAVMYLGRIVETGPVREVLRSPAHPYTRGLLNALPKLEALDEPLTPVPGDIPSPLERPPGCVFHTRCPVVIEGRAGSKSPRQCTSGTATARRASCWRIPRSLLPDDRIVSHHRSGWPKAEPDIQPAHRAALDVGTRCANPTCL